MYGLTDKQVEGLRYQMDRRHVDELRSWLTFANSMNAHDVADMIEDEIQRRDDLIRSTRAVGVVTLAFIDNPGDPAPYVAPLTYHYSIDRTGVYEVNTGLEYTVTYVNKPLIAGPIRSDYQYTLTTIKGHKAYLSPHIVGTAQLLKRDGRRI